VCRASVSELRDSALEAVPAKRAAPCTPSLVHHKRQMDTLSPEQRSERMRRVRQAGTRPELVVRRALHAMGFRITVTVHSTVRSLEAPCATTEIVLGVLS
jgi:hypothetical protein